MPGDLNYCVRCGALLTWYAAHANEPPVLGCSDPACGRIAYRNAKPCAGVLIEDAGRVLLVQRAVAPFRGAWDIPGGFLDEWEHPAQGAVREVREETGLVVELTALLGIFIDTYGGADYNTLNVYYRGRVVGGSPQASDDAAALAWFTPADLPTEIAYPGHALAVLAAWQAACARDPHPQPTPDMAVFVAAGIRPGMRDVG